MLRRYLTDLGEEPGRYLRYISQPESEEIDDSEDDVPTRAAERDDWTTII
jgi:palmitoyltransferase ZDHHC6